MRCALVYCLVVDLTISVLVSVGLLFHDVELDVGGIPSARHNTGTGRTTTTDTAHTPASMRAPQAPMPPHHRPSTGTANHQPPRAPSVHANGYNRRPYSATQTTRCAWEPHTASPIAPTAETSTPTTANGPQLQPRPPPTSHPSLSKPLTDALRDHLGVYYVVDATDHAWTIAMATGSAPLPSKSPPLRHRRGGLNVAARHIFLALYLHHRDLHLPDPQLPALRAATPAPEAWAGTAPQEIADYLRITCRWFNTALGRQI